jgi:hypothetical protein
MNLRVVEGERGKAQPDSGESEPSQIGVVPPIAEIQPTPLRLSHDPKLYSNCISCIWYSPLLLHTVEYNMGKKRKRQANDDAGPQIRKKPDNGEAVPDGIFHYRRLDDVPWDTQK